MGWLDHDRLGFNYRLSDIACALGIAQLERLGDMLGARALLAERYRAALAGIEGLGLPCPDDGRRRARLVRVRRAAPARGGSRRDGSRARRRADPEQALPAGDPPDELSTASASAIVPGEFPVCEDVAARSLALPFFPQMTEGQVSRVADGLRGALGQ